MHDGKFCKQTDGVVMVSSLGPKLSNIFAIMEIMATTMSCTI